MSAAPTNALTAVVLMPRQFDELAASLFHLRRQTIARLIEVVLVHTPAGRDSIDVTRFDEFCGFRPVQIDAIATVAAGFVAGAQAATAPVVALVEDHVFLDPRWAEWVCEAHAAPCAAVAPRMRNANPDTFTSWANFLACFGEAFTLDAATPLESGPGHNTAYKRSVLQHYDAELQTLYQSERTFHYRLRHDGHTIIAEPRAELAHVNISIPREALAHAFLGGILFGQYRAVGMRALEKVARSVLAPLVPPLRLWRTLRALGPLQVLNGEAPVLAFAMLPLLLVAHAAGEVAGYWRLVRGVEARYEHFELHRIACVRPAERALLLQPPA
jgi:hypothetical protein